jgi:hypothetical protein
MAIKISKKIVYGISNNERKILELIKLAGEVVIKEDKELLKELAKY